MDCAAHEKHKITCPTNKNDFKVWFSNEIMNFYMPIKDHLYHMEAPTALSRP